MLYTTINEKGILKIVTDEPIEAYALFHWLDDHKKGVENLIIETGRTFNMSELTALVGKEIASWRSWQKEMAEKAVVKDIVA